MGIFFFFFVLGSGEGGASVAQLQLEPSSLQAVLQACAGDSDTVRVTPREGGAASTGGKHELVALVCKKCRLAFQSEKSVNSHTKNCGGNILRIFSGCQEPESPKRPHDPPPPASSPSAGLSHEMEDVVNQITALAAQAKQQAHDGNSDSNANIFCPPPEPKKSKLFTTPTGVAVPSTGQ